MHQFNHDPKYIQKRVRKRNSVIADNMNQSPSPPKRNIQNTNDIGSNREREVDNFQKQDRFDPKIFVNGNASKNKYNVLAVAAGLIEPLESPFDVGASDIPQSSNTVNNSSIVNNTDNFASNNVNLPNTATKNIEQVFPDTGEDDNFHDDIIFLTETIPQTLNSPDDDVIVLDSDSEEDTIDSDLENDLSEISKIAIKEVHETVLFLSDESVLSAAEDVSVETIVEILPKKTITPETSSHESTVIQSDAKVSPINSKCLTETSTTSLIKGSDIVDQGVLPSNTTPAACIQDINVATAVIQNAPNIKEYKGIERTVTHFLESQNYVPNMKLEEYKDYLSFHVAQKTKDRQESIRGLENIGSANIPTDKSFSVLSYNVLSQAKLEKNPRFYPKMAIFPQIFQWRYRWQLLARDLHNFQADICCIQEVERDTVQECYDSLMVKRDGYTAFYAWRENKEKDGYAIYWKSEKFDKVEEIVVPLNYGFPNLNKSNVGQILVLKHKKAEKELIVVNTQLISEPKSGAEKLIHLSVIFAYLQKIRIKNQPVIFCGDFALKYNSLLYKFITDGEIDCTKDICNVASLDGNGRYRNGANRLERFLIPDAAKISNNCTLIEDGEKACTSCTSMTHPFKFESVYGTTAHNGNNILSTFHHKTSTDEDIICGKPDFIFYSIKQKGSIKKLKRNKTAQKEVIESDLFLHRRLSLPDKDSLEEVVALTLHDVTGSDHLPLFAEFFLP